MLISGASPATVLGLLGVALAIGLPLAILAWRRFTYRVEGGQLEVRQGVLVSSLRTIPLSRVRGIDITAPLLHRLAGLVAVRVDDATGGRGSSGLRLAAVTRADAEALREAVLTPGRAAAGAPVEAAPEPALAAVGAGTLALGGATSGRYLLVPLAAVAAVVNLVDDGLPGVDRVLELAEERAPTDPLVLAALAAVVLVVAVGAAALGSVLVDGGFRLTEARGRLVAERGLIARRSVAIDRRRVRAYEVRDTPLWRALGLASLRAVVGGIPEGRGDASGRTTLVPVDRRQAVWGLLHRLAPAAPDALDPHPAAARTRRLVRATAPPALAAILLGVLGRPGPAIALGAATLLMVLVGLDRYRSLGHRLDRGWLGLREGSLARRHAMVEPGAVVAYRISASPFQRRVGLCTLTAHLGQGAGSRRALDLGTGEAVAVLARAEPDLVGPLLAAGPPAPQAVAKRPIVASGRTPGRWSRKIR